MSQAFSEVNVVKTPRKAVGDSIFLTRQQEVKGKLKTNSLGLRSKESNLKGHKALARVTCKFQPNIIGYSPIPWADSGI